MNIHWTQVKDLLSSLMREPAGWQNWFKVFGEQRFIQLVGKGRLEQAYNVRDKTGYREIKLWLIFLYWTEIICISIREKPIS